MLTKLQEQLRRYDMVRPGDTVICAVSGGADSVALLFAFYLLREKLNIRLEAAHFNHHLRGAESQRDEDFVRDLCDRFDIPLTIGGGEVCAGKKGLEAAAREARYAFFATLNGKIATAHTADDNAETVLMHLVRGTGLKGLGGIAPVNGKIIRPMLTVTQQEVLMFLQEYHLQHIQDSSNDGDDFLRNRLRHHVLPLLKEENPRLSENLSDMAMELRFDARELEPEGELPPVSVLRQMGKALRSRHLEAFLKRNGVKEPERSHIRLAESLVFSDRPSARGNFPGGVTVCRRYDRLEVLRLSCPLEEMLLPCPGQIELSGYRISCRPAEQIVNTQTTFTVQPRGNVILRSRREGDSIRLPGGTKSLKKLFIDRKIPADRRLTIPVLADDEGILGVYSIGVHQDRVASRLPAVTICVEHID